mgnify:CR=1 FL=1
MQHAIDFPFNEIRGSDGDFFSTAEEASAATGLDVNHIWSIADHDGTITYGPATSWVNVYGYFATAEAHDGCTYYIEATDAPSTVTTCKQTARGIRIWLEGAKLTNAGFAPDTPYSTTYDADAKCITLRVDSTSKKRVTNGSRNGQPRPIIDLMNKSVASVFSGGTQVRATFGANVITIREA